MSEYVVVCEKEKRCDVPAVFSVLAFELRSIFQ